MLSSSVRVRDVAVKPSDLPAHGGFKYSPAPILNRHSYRMMRLKPLAAGVHVSLTSSSPAVAVNLDAPGVVEGTADRSFDANPPPELFHARTWNV